MHEQNQTPTTYQQRNPRELASWLTASRARLDASQTGGNVATRLLVPDSEDKGQWVLSLKGGIDIIDQSDLRFATKGPAHVVVRESDDPNSPTIEVQYTGTDGETRSAEVDPQAELQFIPAEIN